MDEKEFEGGPERMWGRQWNNGIIMGTLSQHQLQSTEPPRGQARYQAIAADLAGRIAAGDWPVGEFLPSEPGLAAEYGVSRETLRSALKQIEGQGLIGRRKGQGTRVVRALPITEFSSRLASIDDLVSYGQTAARSILAVDEVTLDAQTARLAGLKSGALLTRVTTTRQSETDAAMVASWSRIYLSNEDWQLIRGGIQDSERLVADLICAKTGRAVDRVVQRIRSTTVPADAASHLHCSPGALALEFTRQYVDRNAGIFVVVVSLHPGDTFVYETILEPR
jgi:GntR family transcriptional regulator